MDLVPGVFNEGDGDIAEGWRELGANPSSSYLFVSVIASPENAGVECISDDSGDVGGLDGALCRVFLVVSADVGVVEGIAGGLNIHSESVCGLLLLPVLYHGVDCIDQSVVKCGRHRVEGSCCWSCLWDADQSNSSAQVIAAAWRSAARQLA